MAGSLLEVTDQTWESEVLKSPTPVLVDFWAVWCGPCKMIAPHVAEMAEKYDGRLKVVKLDVDQNQRTATNYGIRSIPTLLLIKDGKVVDQVIGAVPKSEIQKRLDRVLAG
jgi:thioredoxin 1